MLADHRHLIRDGVRLLLETESDFDVTAEAADGLRVPDLVGRWKPRILILASEISGLTSSEVIRRVRQRSPDTAVIVLSHDADERHVLEALGSGAAGYVVTEAKSSELTRAIRKVATGLRYLSAPLSTRPMQSWMERVKARTPDPLDALTSREREIFSLVAEGHSNSGIANLLSISRRTAESHRANLMRKLHLSNQADLIRFALGLGISVSTSARDRERERRRPSPI